MCQEPTSVDPEWLKIEYDQINQYARNVYQSVQTLAQMTFVINPALGAAYYYLAFEKSAPIVARVGQAGFVIAVVAIAFLGTVYNVGALFVYRGSHRSLAAFLLRIREIDEIKSSKLHEALEVVAPRSYTDYWRSDNQKHFSARERYLSGDQVTRYFMLFLISLWIAMALMPIVQAWGSSATSEVL